VVVDPHSFESAEPVAAGHTVAVAVVHRPLVAAEEHSVDHTLPVVVAVEVVADTLCVVAVAVHTAFAVEVVVAVLVVVVVVVAVEVEHTALVAVVQIEVADPEYIEVAVHIEVAGHTASAFAAVEVVAVHIAAVVEAVVVGIGREVAVRIEPVAVDPAARIAPEVARIDPVGEGVAAHRQLGVAAAGIGCDSAGSFAGSVGSAVAADGFVAVEHCIVRRDNLA